MYAMLSEQYTFRGSYCGQFVHVRGLPAFHHGFAHDFEVGVCAIISSVRVLPYRLVVLAFGEYFRSRHGENKR